MIENEIGVWLDAKGHGVIGTSVFLGQLPDAITPCVAVLPYESLEPWRTFEGIIAERVLVQFLVRGATGSSARQLAGAIFADAAAVANEDISGVRYFAMTPRTPVVVDVDDRGCTLCSVNVEVIKAVSPS